MTEWELMCVAADIEPGDTVEVKVKKGIEKMVYIGEESQYHIRMKDQKSKVRLFSVTNLEEKDNPRHYILGKASEQLSLKGI